MNNLTVVDLADASNGKKVGGKARSLGAMVRAGFNVPEGFVVTTDVFDSWIPELKSAIFQHYDKLDAKFVAVRSSAVNEDGHNAAWAGQLDTFLNVTRDDLLESVQKCWDSVNSVRAKAYAQHNMLEVGSVGVLVQKMIQSETSGVAFSVHPVTKNADHIVIEAGFGLGEAIVSGQITPDTYIVQKDPCKIIERQVAKQLKELVQDASGLAVWRDLGERATKQKLQDNEIIILSVIVKELERHFGYPVDVEWAFCDQICYLLQSRPITTLDV